MIDNKLYLGNCNLCPRKCSANRFSQKLGYCNTDNKINVSSICNHQGEEPPIRGNNGICNIFFSHCNLQCIYCQNYQISNNSETNYRTYSLEQIVDIIIEYINKGCMAVGFVSGSHVIIQIIQIIELLAKKGYSPIYVYNSNGYDSVDALKLLEPYINVYLPDYKYSDNAIAFNYSHVSNYPQIAYTAINEMYKQKGSNLTINANGYVENGLIIRHLVLPNNITNSIGVLQAISSISNAIAISLMSQYYPTYNAYMYSQLNRTVTKQEYETVINELNRLGFYKGWIQEFDSNEYYRPDFNKTHPFE